MIFGLFLGLWALQIANCTAIPPSMLISFDVIQSQSTGVCIEWETDREIDIMKMYVERVEVPDTSTRSSETGNPSVIGERKAEGSYWGGAAYSLTDSTVRPGTMYEYRLIRVDLDGTEEILARERIPVRGDSCYPMTVEVSPNIVGTQAARICWNVPTGIQPHISIVDARGLVVYSVKPDSTGGRSMEFDVMGIPDGLYLIILDDDRCGGEIDARMYVRKAHPTGVTLEDRINDVEDCEQTVAPVHVPTPDVSPRPDIR